MEIQEEDVKTLTSLELTPRQARVYLALVLTGRTTIKKIAKVAKVSRQDIYRIIAALQKLGLVDRALTLPATFKAVSLEEGLAILLQRQKKALCKTQLEAERLFEKFREQLPDANSPQEEPQFILIAGRERIATAFREDLATAQKCISMSSSWEVFREFIFDFNLNLTEAGKRGVVFRAAINRPYNDNAFLAITQFLKKNPMFSLRFTREEKPLFMLITDKNAVNMFMDTITTVYTNDLTMMKSTNRIFTNLAQFYFESMWNQAEKNLTHEYNYA